MVLGMIVGTPPSSPLPPRAPLCWPAPSHMLLRWPQVAVLSAAGGGDMWFLLTPLPARDQGRGAPSSRTRDLGAGIPAPDGTSLPRTGTSAVPKGSCQEGDPTSPSFAPHLLSSESGFTAQCPHVTQPPGPSWRHAQAGAGGWPTDGG